jgi:cytochrome c-type biogenesis protein CcmH
MMRIIHILVLFFALPLTVTADIDAYLFDDPDKEVLYKKLIKELRCTVCQNQDIADSNADLASDLRRKTYKMVQDGKSEVYVKDYMAQRYGDFILYKPPLQTNTLLLWVGPFIILLVGVFVMLRFIRRKPAVDDAILSEADRSRAEDLLDKN